MTTSIEQELRTEILTTVDELEQLSGPWRRLWQQVPWATPFQTPAWLLPWCRCWGDRDVHVLSLWQGDSLVGLVPWRIDLDDKRRRRALLIGAGVSDYLDALIAPRCEETAAAAVLAHLLELRDEIDVFELGPLAPNGFLSRSLHSSRFGREGLSGTPCPVLPLDEAATDLAGCLPKSPHKKLQYYRRRLERSGTVEYESAGPENFDACFSALVELHTMRWNGREQPGIFDDPAVERFHREAARGLLQHGLLRQYMLRLDDQAIAAYYGFHAHGRSYYYLSGFEPSYRRVSPGMLIVGYAIEEALKDEATVFDFLRGRESYKYSWGAHDRPTYHWRLARS